MIFFVVQTYNCICVCYILHVFKSINLCFVHYSYWVVVCCGFQTMKMKSSHDVLQDPKLSSQPVVETIATVKV